MSVCGASLEASGAAILCRRPVAEVGSKLVECGESLKVLSLKLKELAPDVQDGDNSSQRMGYASERMILAGNELLGTPKPKAKGKSWLKG